MARNTDRIKQDLKNRMKANKEKTDYRYENGGNGSTRTRYTNNYNNTNSNTDAKNKHNAKEKIQNDSFAKEFVKADSKQIATVKSSKALNNTKVNKGIGVVKRYAENLTKEKDDITSGSVESFTDSAKATAKTVVQSAHHTLQKKRLSANVRQTSSTYAKKSYTQKQNLSSVGYGSAKNSNFSSTGTHNTKKRHNTINRTTNQGAVNRAKNVVLTNAKMSAKLKSVKKGAKAAKVVKKIAKGIGLALKSLGKVAVLAAAPLLPIIILVLFVIIIVVMLISPYGFFFSENKHNMNPIKSIVEKIDAEWTTQIEAEKTRWENAGYDEVNVENGDGDGDGMRINNWKDVLTLYAIRNTSNKKGMLTFEEGDIQGIRDLFFSMNTIRTKTYTREEISIEEVEEDEEYFEEETWYNPISKKTEKRTVKKTRKVTVEKEVKKIIKCVDIIIENKRIGEMNLTATEKMFADDFLDPENSKMWEYLGLDFATIIGNNNGYLSDKDLQLIFKDLPPGASGNAAIQFAMTLLGKPYILDGYNDCSGLTRRAYASVGIDIGWTAAGQAQQAYNSGRIIDPSAAQPGDLIFWSYPNSSRVRDRFMQIGHVAIYLGNGMMIESAPSTNGVAIGPVSRQGTPILWARPS